MSIWYFWFPLVMSLAGAYGLLRSGNYHWDGWAVGLATEFLWYAYAIGTHQWAFLIGTTIWTYVFAKNLLKWKREPQGSQA